MASYYSFFVCLIPIIIKIISKILAVAFKALAARYNLKCISTHFARNLKEEKNNDDQITLNKIERGLRSCMTFLQPSLMMLSVSFTALHSQCFPPLDPSTWAPSPQDLRTYCLCNWSTLPCTLYPKLSKLTIHPSGLSLNYKN